MHLRQGQKSEIFNKRACVCSEALILPQGCARHLGKSRFWATENEAQLQCILSFEYSAASRSHFKAKCFCSLLIICSVIGSRSCLLGLSERDSNCLLAPDLLISHLLSPAGEYVGSLFACTTQIEELRKVNSVNEKGAACPRAYG